MSIGVGQIAKFVAKLGIARHHVVGDTAVELTDAGGAERHVKAFVARLVGLKAFGHVAQLANHARRHFDGVHRLRRQRGMRLLAAHAALVAVHALVRRGRQHAGGFAHDAGQRGNAGVFHVGDQPLHAEAADFLVVAQRQVHGKGRGAVQKISGVRQRHADKTLHVAAAPAIKLAVLDRGRQRVQRPVLPVPGHGVGMARQNNAGRLAFAQRGKQVGLAFVGVVGEAAGHTELFQLVAHKVNQLQVGVLADRVHAHQRLDQLQGVRRGGRGGKTVRGKCLSHASILAAFGNLRSRPRQLCSNDLFLTPCCRVSP